MKKDPAIAEIRATRKKISAKFEFDLHKLVEHYKQRQKKYKYLIAEPSATKK